MPLSVGKTLRMIREAKGITLGDAARRARVSVPYLSLVETERRSPWIDVLRRLGSALGLPGNFLLLVATAETATLRSQEGKAARLLTVLERLETVHSELANEVETGTE